MTAAVIIPTLNEIAHIEALLVQLLAEPEARVGAILVTDGGSSDGTREIVLRMAEHARRIRLVDNPARIQSAGINRAVALLEPRFTEIVRVDAHALYPDKYVSSLLDALARTGADSVVVRMNTVGRTPFQRAVAAAQNSRIGTGGSAHRMGTGSGYVDHGHHAAFRRAMFERVGGYDTSFVANEDAELDARIRVLGGRIWLEGSIPVTYFPRGTIRGLAKQYWRYGVGRARTVLKHGERPKLRQMLPPLVVIALALALAGALVTPWLLLVPLFYALALLAGVAPLALAARSPGALMAAPALATMHVAWGAGFLRQMAAGKRRGVQPVVRRSIDVVAKAQQDGNGG